MTKRNIFYTVINALLLFFSVDVYAQTNANFDISLRIDFTSADQLLDYFDRYTNSNMRIAELRGNQLAAATSVLLARTNRSTDDFQQQLELARDYAHYENDIYGLLPAKKHIAELRKLLTEIKQRKLDRKVVATLASYFPDDLKMTASIPVYFVAMGNERAVAVVRRVVWKQEVPWFVGDEEGDPVIIFNLVRVLEMAPRFEEQIIGIMSTLAHESFHAVFSLLRQSLPDSIKPRSYADQLVEIVQNEGIAYALSMNIQSAGYAPMRPWFELTATAITTFNHTYLELLAPNLTNQRAEELMMNANLSGSFEGNYGATAGMRMAYEIDTRLGRPALTSTLSKGGRAFLVTYQQACLQDGTLPVLDKRVLQKIRLHDEDIR
jgi:hypothetical protein